LIDESEEDITFSRIDPISTENLSKNHSEMVKEPHLDQAIEPSITDTLYIFPDYFKSEKLINDKNDLSLKLIDQESARNRDAEESKEKIIAVSSRETSSNVLRNGLVPENNLHTKNNKTFPVTKVYKEIDNYNNKGYLSVRKNGLWGKLCLDMNIINNLTQERHPRVACKAITYQ